MKLTDLKQYHPGQTKKSFDWDCPGCNQPWEKYNLIIGYYSPIGAAFPFIVFECGNCGEKYHHHLGKNDREIARMLRRWRGGFIAAPTRRGKGETMFSPFYFNITSGLNDTIKVPPGTCADIKAHVEDVTKKLKLKLTQYKGNPPHWDKYTAPKEVSNAVASKTIFYHNRRVKEFYAELALWSESPPDEFEELTPEFFSTILYGLSTLSLTYDRWTADVYREEMEMLFEAMQGNEQDSLYFGADALSAEQAAAVIGTFATYFDREDIRLTKPNDCDWLVTSDEYYWCLEHGAWLSEQVWNYNEDEEGGYPDVLICPAEGCEEEIG